MTFSWVPEPGEKVEVVATAISWGYACVREGEIMTVVGQHSENLIICRTDCRSDPKEIFVWHPEVSMPRYGFAEIKLQLNDEWEGNLELT